MSEVTDYALVRDEIASFIGTPEEKWDSRTAGDVESAIRKGIDAVIHNASNHQWTWMRPIHRFKTSSGERRYPLPPDFEQVIDGIYFDGEFHHYCEITQLPASRLIQLHGQVDETSVPTSFATEVEIADGTARQEQILVLHPTPDKAYDLIVPYQVGPIRTLSTERPWFPGGPENRELFIASCLAMTESKFMDIDATDKRELYQEALTAAIGRDQRKQPRNLGQMMGGRHGGRRGYMSGRDWYRHKLPTTIRGNAGY